MAGSSPDLFMPPAAALSDPTAAAAWLERNAVESLPTGGLEQRLKQSAADGKPLRVKLGIDPTAPDIHLGFAVVLGKLREFQELGHSVVLIIGDWTARVGDPSGRSSTRPVLSPEQIDANARTFADQALKVLRSDRLEVRRNREWLDMPIERLFALLRSVTVAQISERDDISKRLDEGLPVSLLEMIYPVLQGWDSVAVEADVEVGGTDQHFNLLLGRDVQRSHGRQEQVALEMPILTGTDGVKKMSKTLGNYIGVCEPPDEIFGKTMSIPDTALPEWYALLLDRQPDALLGPRDAKRELARALCDRFHGDGAGEAAQRSFDRRFIERELPEDAEIAVIEAGGDGTVHMPALIASAYGVSRSEARRNLESGAIRVDGVSFDRLDATVAELDGKIIQRGKKRDPRRLSVEHPSRSA